MNKYLPHISVALSLVVLLVLLFGGSAKFGGVTNFDQLDAANPPTGGSAYTVSSTAAINAAGEYVGAIRNTASSTLGAGALIGTNGSFITKLRCNSEAFNAPSLATNATTTTDIPLVGFASNTPQVQWGTYNSSTNFEVGVIGTSSDGIATLLITNRQGTIDDSGGTISACYVQF